MRVSHLSLRDFRNYQQAELALESGANLLVGRNGQGKTNLAEAIAYFGSLTSHRTTGDAPLIRAGQEAAIMRMLVQAGERSVSLEMQLNRTGQNRAQINGNPVRPRELTRWFAAVAFVPEDLSLVRGEPGVRRKFLDASLAVRLPLAAGVIADYERVLRQRTTLLKSLRATPASAAAATLQVWDEKLVELGSKIIAARRDLVRDLADPLRRSYQELVAADHNPQLHLRESIFTALDVSRETSGIAAEANVSRETITMTIAEIAERYRATLEEVRPRELERGVTLVGPHRDDLLLELNNLPVKGYASHGESWSFALAIKLALAQILRNESPAGDPVIILDDVFAELDAGRRERLMNAVRDYEQVIVTAAVEEDIPADISWHKVRIASGEIL